MPSLSALQEFKSSFGDIGNQRADLATRELHYDDLELPENEPTPLPETAPQADSEGGDTAPDGSPDLDFGDLDLPPLGDVPPMDDFGLPDGLLDGLTDDLNSPPDFPEEGTTPEAEPPAGDFNMDDLGLGDLPGMDTPAADEPTPDAEPPAGDFNMDDLGLGDLPDMEPQPSEFTSEGSPLDTPADEPAAEALAEAPTDDFSLPDLGDIPGMDTPADEPAPEAPADDFSLPDLGDIPGMDEPAAEAPAEAPTDDFSLPDLGDIPGMDTPAVDEPAAEVPADDDFSLPDLGDLPSMEPQPSEFTSEGSPLDTPAEDSVGGGLNLNDVANEPLDLGEGMDLGSEPLDSDSGADIDSGPLDLDGGMDLGSESPELGDSDLVEEAESVPAEEGEPQPSAEGDALPDFGDFDIPDIPDTDASEPQPSEFTSEGSPLDTDTTLPDFGDFGSADDFGISAAAGKEKPAKKTPQPKKKAAADDTADTDLGGEPQPSEDSPLDDFSLPDIPEDIDLGGGDAAATPDFGADADADGIDMGGEAPADFGADDFGIPDIPDTGDSTDLGGEPQPSEFTSEGSPLDADSALPDFGADFSVPDADVGGDADTATAPDFGTDFSVPDANTSAGEEAPPASPVDFGGADDFGIPDTGAAAPPDNFDAFNFDEETPLVSDSAGGASPAGDSGGGMGDIDLGDDPFASDMDFHLPGIDDLISTPGGAKGAAAKPAAKKPGPAAKDDDEDKVEEIKLTDEDLDKFVQTLTSYPLNLRIASEEVIAEQVVAPDLMSRMVKLLVNGAPAKETAALAGKILSRRIDIPKGYEKSSGEQFEREQGSLAYIFFHSFLPILRLFAVIAVLVGCVSYLVYQFIYKPISAERLYKIGYERIFAGEYQRANERFTEAFNRHRKKSWFYKYAEGFRDERQYIYAEQKYDELLYYYQRDKKGVLDYAYMETYYIRDYEKADRLLRNQLLDYAPYDMEGLLAQGDNALAWGEIDPAKYEDARFAYARLLDRYGWRDSIVERMMKYFIRTDNLKEVLPLYDYFNYDPKRKISADTLSELGGYLLDKTLEESRGVPNEYVEQIGGIRDLLLRAVAADPSLPESHYHLARYYENLNNDHEERITLENAIKNFDSAREESIRRLKYRIDAQRRYGDNLIRSTEFFTAEESLVKGINIYEDSISRRLIQRSPEFGKMYASLGDLEYFTKRGDWQKALDYYHRSEQNGWCPPEIQYRMGSSYYLLQDWQNALKYLFTASSELPLNRRMLFALGNASYQRGDNFAAQAYYTRLMEVLDSERARLPLLLPNDRVDYLELAERIMMAMNNAGVANELLARQTGNAQYRSRALGLYAESSRAWDSLTRNPETMIRSGSKPIPLLNSQNLLYPPLPSYEPQIFVRIDRDVLEPSEWEALMRRVRPVENSLQEEATMEMEEDTALMEYF